MSSIPSIVMNPYPFLLSNHLIFPCGMDLDTPWTVTGPPISRHHCRESPTSLPETSWNRGDFSPRDLASNRASLAAARETETTELLSVLLWLTGAVPGIAALRSTRSASARPPPPSESQRRRRRRRRLASSPPPP